MEILGLSPWVFFVALIIIIIFIIILVTRLIPAAVRSIYKKMHRAPTNTTTDEQNINPLYYSQKYIRREAEDDQFPDNQQEAGSQQEVGSPRTELSQGLGYLFSKEHADGLFSDVMRQKYVVDNYDNLSWGQEESQ